VRTNQISGELTGSLSDRAEEAATNAAKALKDSNAAVGKSRQAEGAANSAEQSSAGALKGASMAQRNASTSLALAQGARQEADSFEKDIVSAKTQAAEAESHLADALRAAANAEGEVLKVRQAAAPRRLSEAQKLELVARLSAMPKFTVAFLPPTNATKEVFDFEDDLTNVFVRLKLLPSDTPSASRGIVSLAPSAGKGVIVGVMGIEQGRYPPAASVLLTMLHDWGFEVSSEAAPNIVTRPDDMRILVSSKQ
jgi:hypothetical protein